jgi:hypothetical protein
VECWLHATFICISVHLVIQDRQSERFARCVGSSDADVKLPITILGYLLEQLEVWRGLLPKSLMARTNKDLGNWIEAGLKRRSFKATGWPPRTVATQTEDQSYRSCCPLAGDRGYGREILICRADSGTVQKTKQVAFPDLTLSYTRVQR